MFLFKVEAAVSVMQVEHSIKKFLDKFFKEYNLPMPRIKIVNNVGSRWLGRDSYSPRVDKNNTVMEIQKRITGDEKTLDRVIAHELIHHYSFLVNFAHPEHGEDNWKKAAQKSRLGFKEDAHGKEFKEWADKINAVMGKDYVTEKSDESFVIESDKDFFILLSPVNKDLGKIGWAWTVRPSEEQKNVIKQKIMEGSKLFTSRDEKFTAGVKIKKYGGISVPIKKELQDELKEMYKSGKTAQPSWLTAPMSVSKDAEKFKSHYGKDLENILKNDPLGVLK
jgi:predicted SprT family Zn-dependent metalloprotease